MKNPWQIKAPRTFPKRYIPECKNPNLFGGIYVIIPNIKIPKMPFSPHPAAVFSGFLCSGFSPFLGFTIFTFEIISFGNSLWRPN
jgi:hypothetical protein